MINFDGMFDSIDIKEDFFDSSKFTVSFWIKGT